MAHKLRAVDPISGWRLYYPNRETTLYYIKFTYCGKYYYKIGITTTSIQRRFAGETVPYKILWTKVYKSGRSAYIREQKILNKFTKYRCTNVNFLRSGNRELFTKNIMKDMHGK